MQILDSEFLEERPEARAIKVEDLMRDMQRGRVRVPPFQRPFEWKRDDARALIDSIYRGYPIGNLLLWEQPAEAGEYRISPGLNVKAEARGDAWWVVDGQQRLASLARVLLTTDGVHDDFALDIDLDERKVVAARTQLQRQADPTRWLPLNRVIHSEQLVAWLVSARPSDQRQVNAIQAGRRLREYDVPAYIVRTNEESVLREVFRRSNEAGKRLEVHQVFEALNSGRRGAQPISLAAMADALAQLDFGRIDEALVYRALRVVQGQDVVESGRERPKRLPDAVVEQAYADTQRALSAAVQFLESDVGIPHIRVLPYKEPLVTLAKFFHFHREPKARSRLLLARWLWRGALNGSHQGNTVATRQALALVSQSDEEGSVQELLRRVGDAPPAWPAADMKFNFRYATTKLHTLAMLELQPRDLETGERINPSDWLSEKMHEANDQTLPTILRRDTQASLRGSIANRLIHPAMGGSPKAKLLKVSSDAVLASHAVSAEALAALREGDELRFLQLRAARLGELFGRVFGRHARWDETDRPSIQSLLLGDED